MALTRFTGFEVRPAAAIDLDDTLASGVGLFFDSVQATGTVAIETAQAHSGNTSLRINKTGAQASTYVQWTISGNQLSARVWLRFNATPTATSDIILASTAAGTNIRLVAKSDGKLYFGAVASPTGTDGTVLSTGTWYRIDLSIDISVQPWAPRFKINGGSTVLGDGANIAPSTFSSFRLGSGTTAHTIDLWYDDFQLSDDIADFDTTVFGDGVEGLFPAADGTHNLGGQISNNAGGTTSLFQAVDDWATTTTDTTTYIRQTAGGAGNGSYAEIDAQAATRTSRTPLALASNGAVLSATTTANNATLKVRNGAGTEQNLFSGDISETAPRYANLKLVTAPGGTWDWDEIDAVVWRFGFSTDASPEPRVTALGHEVLWQTVTVTQKSGTDSGTGADSSSVQVPGTPKSGSDSATGAETTTVAREYRNDAEATLIDAEDLTIALSGDNGGTSDKFDLVQHSGTNTNGRILIKTVQQPYDGSGHYRFNVGTTTPDSVYAGWGANSSAGWNKAGSTWVHVYLKIPSIEGYPSGNMPIITALNPSVESGIWLNETGKLQAYDSLNFGTIGSTTIPLGQYVRIEAKFNANTDTVEWRLYLDPDAAIGSFDESITETAFDGVEPIQGIVFGQKSGAGVDVLMDEFAVSNTDWPALAGTTNLAKSATQTATGADASSLATAITASESGTGADASSLNMGVTPKAGSDAGTGADASSLEEASSVTEAGAGADTYTSTRLAATDAGTGADSSAVSVPKAVTEAGTGADASSLSADYLSTEAGTGADAVTVTARAVAESATGADASSLVAARAVTDAGSGDETSLAQQVLHPDGVISAGAWQASTGTLVTTVDEQIADDADYDFTGSTSTMELSLEDAFDAGLSAGHEVLIRYEKEGTGTVDLTFRLVQGTTVLDSWTVSNVADPVAQVTHVLTGTVADSITDYSDLRVRVEATVT